MIINIILGLILGFFLLFILICCRVASESEKAMEEIAYEKDV